MMQEKIENYFDKNEFKVKQKWINIEEVTKDFLLALLSAEDKTFFSHYGFNIRDMLNAWHFYIDNPNSPAIFGASTITQQTAKNLFLYKKPSITRKIFELYFTILMELLLDKKRILEIYINIIELGKGVYGIGTASDVFYQKTAKDLTKQQAILIACMTTNPQETSVLSPSAYVMQRYQHIKKEINRARILRLQLETHIIGK